MKKTLACLMAAVMIVLAFTGCGAAPAEPSSQPESSSSVPAEEPAESSSEPAEAPAEKADIRVAALKGPTSLGMLGVMEAGEAGTAANNYTFEIAAAPDDIVGKIATGEVDVAAVPTNLAPVLYQKTEGKVQMAAINTLGILYVLTKNEEVSSIADLAGKTVISSGQGAVPEYAFNYILEKNGLDPAAGLTVEYKSEHSEVASALMSAESAIAVLPQPFVTQVTAKDANVKTALDLTAEWDKAVDDGSVLSMGCIIVRTDFLAENKEAFDRFLDEYKASVEAVNADPAHAGGLSEHFDIIPAAVAEKAIPNCNIVFMEGDEMKQAAAGFYQVLFDANPKSVGGKLPDDAFYYSR
ncbi:MAG: ABC transporter substrate-binding protein [Oscillospiraceae bacterium]|nr:ABC transporter substrate-binding protein [Oscillospiraceae bacterium]